MIRGIKRKLLYVLLTFIALAVFKGCGSEPSGTKTSRARDTGYVEPVNPDYLLYGGRYNDALALIESQRRQYVTDKNEISFLLDTGLLRHYAGDYRQSAKDLQEAGRLMEEAFTKDMSNDFASMMSGNPKNSQYGGEDYEDIYLQVFNSLNYYHQGNLESAMVEIRRMYEKLRYMDGEYQKQAARLNIANTPREQNFTNSALARYLGMLFWRGHGNEDNARIEAEELANAFAEFPNVYNFPLPQSLVLRNNVNEETSIPAGRARLNGISFTGLSEVKTVVNDNFQFWKGFSQAHDAEFD
jgi:tetratricopeptide (TPR) repeat protein